MIFRITGSFAPKRSGGLVRHSARNLRGLQRGEAGIVSAPKEKAHFQSGREKDELINRLVLRIKG